MKGDCEDFPDEGTVLILACNRNLFMAYALNPAGYTRTF